MNNINEMTTRLFGRNIEDDLKVLEALQKRYSINAPLIKKLEMGNKETYTKEAMTIKHGLSLVEKTLIKLKEKV